MVDGSSRRSIEHVEAHSPGADAPLALLPSRKGLALTLAACLLLLPACSSSRIEKENDRLRLENQSLRDRVEQLTATNAELNSKLHELAASRGPADDDVLAALPRVASIECGSLSGFYPGDTAKPATSVKVYIRPLDGRQRFTQAVGTLSVEALILPKAVGSSDASADTSPSAQLVRRLSPLELRDAYRSGLTGTHYEVDLPLETPLKDRNVTILVRAELSDAVTGSVHKVEKLIKPASSSPESKPTREAASK